MTAKQIFASLSVLAISILPAAAQSNPDNRTENRWNVTVGGSISHLTPKTYGGYSFGWGGGALVAGGYEINFTSHWSLNPQLEFSFINDGATLRHNGNKVGLGYDARKFLNLDIPVIASFRVPLNNGINFRIGAGPVLQESLAGWGKDPATNKNASLHSDFAHRFNIGVQGEVAVETGRHWSYLAAVRYPFAKENWMGETLTLSVGLRYSF